AGWGPRAGAPLPERTAVPVKRPQPRRRATPGQGMRSDRATTASRAARIGPMSPLRLGLASLVDQEAPCFSGVSWEKSEPAIALSQFGRQSERTGVWFRANASRGTFPISSGPLSCSFAREAYDGGRELCDPGHLL